MDINDVIAAAPDALAELTRELIRRADEEYKKDKNSQLTACFLMGIRSASLLFGIVRLIEPETHDSAEVLSRAFLEARDLLLTFRFDHKGTRDKIGYWFARKVDNSWKGGTREVRGTDGADRVWWIRVRQTLEYDHDARPPNHICG